MRFRKTLVAFTAALVAVGMFVAPLGSAKVDAGVISYIKLNEFDADADSGIDSAKTYTHLLDFGDGAAATVNGVAFTKVDMSNIDAIPDFNYSVDSGSIMSHCCNDATGVDGEQGINEVFTDLFYNHHNAPGGIGTITLSGLTPGTQYETRIYTRQWGASGRTATWDFDTDGVPGAEDTIPFIDEDDASLVPPSDGSFLANTTYMMSYSFTADSPQLTMSITQHNFNQSWHLYGLSNLVVPEPGTIVMLLGLPAVLALFVRRRR